MVTRNAFTLLLASLLFAGCTGKPSTRNVHSGPQPTNEDTGSALTAKDAANEVQALFKNREAISQRINAAKTGKEALDIAIDLEKTVLSSTVLESPELSGRSEFDAVLSQFHRALNKALGLDQASVVQSGILVRYETAALANCTVEGKGCTRLPVFRGDHLTSRILMQIAFALEPQVTTARDLRLKLSGDDFNRAQTSYFTIVQRYYRLLNLSYEMSNGQSVPELDQKYVKFARDYFAYFRSLSAEYRQPELHRRFRDTMTLALGHLRNQSKGASGLNEQYCQFLIELNPLNPAMFSTMDLDKRSQRSMLAEFMECTTQKGQLASMIQSYVRTNNTQLLSEFNVDKKVTVARHSVKPLGYAYAVEELKDVPFLYNNLNVQLIPRDDMAFFILDRVFYQQMEQNTAQNYWARIKGLDDLKFLQFARNYARLQTAYVLKTTLKNYGLIFTEQFRSKGGLNSEFFYEVVREVNGISQFDWDELRDGLSMIREFIIKTYDARLFRAVSASDKALQKEYLALKEELGGALSDNLAMAVTTPMTVPLYYYMAKAQGTIKFHVPWARDPWFDIPAVDALSQFLTPGTTGTFPFFKFGTMDQSWDELQKLHILDYAMRIGIFEFIDFSLLEEDKNSDLAAEVLFFKQATKDILKTFEYTFKREIERLDSINRNRNFSEYFMSACEDPLKTPVSLELKDLTFSTFLKDPALTESLNSIYSSNGFIPAWRLYRDGIKQMVKVMDNHFHVEGADKRLTEAKLKSRAQIVALANAEIDRFNVLERKYSSQMFELDKKVVTRQRNCLERLHRAEFFRRNQLMAGNIEYYKNVHAAMSVLNILGPERHESVKDVASASQAFNASARGKLQPDVISRANILLQKVEAAGLMSKLDLAKSLNEVLSIHNDDDPTALQYGFFVSGLATLKESGKRVKALNSFTHEFLFQGEWDSLIRNRNLLENTKVLAANVNRELGTSYKGVMALAPNVKIALGTFGELELNSIYTKNTQKHVPFDFDQFKFLRSAMIQFAGAENGGKQFVSWFSDGGLSVSLVERRLKWLKDNQELGVIELADQDVTACPKDQWGRVVAVRDVRGEWLPGAPRIEACQAMRVSATDVMESYLTVMDLLRVSDNERMLLEIMDRPGKLEGRIKSYLAYNAEPSTSKWTYFDQFYRLNYTSIQAYSRTGREWKIVTLEDIRGRGEFQRFKDSYQRYIDDAPALFALRPGPTQIERDSIRERSINHLNAIREFEEAVYDLEQRKVDLGPFLIEKTTTPRTDEPIVMGDWRVMTVKNRSGGARDATPVYLSENNSAKSWFAGFVESFVVKDTDCFFLPQKEDPDFVKESEGDCRTQFNLWKASRETDRLKIRQAFQEAGGR